MDADETPNAKPYLAIALESQAPPEKWLKIFGYSDDLIEIEGAINEELSFYPKDQSDTRYLLFSEGTVLNMRYDENGIWRIAQIRAGSARYVHQPGSIVDDTHDVAYLYAPEFDFVALAKIYRPRKVDKAEKSS